MRASRAVLLLAWLLLVLVVAVFFIVMLWSATSEASAQGQSIERARKHALTHARCLGVKAPSWVKATTDLKRLQRYRRATWKRMRWPAWQSKGAAAWLPLARHAGWPESSMAMLAKVIRRESGGDPSAVLGVHRGLLQIRADHSPATDLFNPYSNLRLGLQMYHRRGWLPWAATARTQKPARPVTDYRPWRRALARAWQFYGEEYWLPRAQVGEQIEMPIGYDFGKGKGWGARAQWACAAVLSFYGQFPQGGLTEEVKDFLRPFIWATDAELRVLYHPPIVDLRGPQ